MLTRRSFVVGAGAGFLAAKDTKIEALQRRTREPEAVWAQPCDGAVKVDLWMLPQATGDGSGSSPENAKGVGALPSVVAPGRHIGLLADKGDWPGFSHSIAAGGAVGASCVIQGVDRARRPTQVVISSSRPRPLLDGWGLLRSSNTQPVLVLRFEARTQSRLEEIREAMEAFLRSQGVELVAAAH